MPLECVVIRCAAQNHAVSGSLERCIVVPAVIEVCRPQSRHSYKRGRLFSTAARRLPQSGQTKPSGQRRLTKNATQFASSENAFWNSESERALAIGCPSWRPHEACHSIHYIWGYLSQRDKPRRLFAAVEARTAGYGGIAAVARATRIAPSTIGRGLKDLAASGFPEGSVRC